MMKTFFAYWIFIYSCVSGFGETCLCFSFADVRVVKRNAKGNILHVSLVKINQEAQNSNYYAELASISIL